MDTATVAAQLLKALGHPARQQILQELEKEEACVCHLEAVLGYRQSYISQHLMKLREAGLVNDRRDGLNVYYSIANTAVTDLLRCTETLAATISGGEIQRTAGSTTKCTCPKCADKP